jgi:hypothetical protein
MTDLEQKPQIPEYGSDEHKRRLIARLRKNLKFRQQQQQPRSASDDRL